MDGSSDRSARLRSLPPAHALLESEEGRALAKAVPADVARDVVRSVLDDLRSDLLEGRAAPDRDALVTKARARLASEAQRARTPRLRRVINATGVVLHTNLGRAPLGSFVLDHVRDVAQGYATLEYDLAAGRRGHRDRLVSAQVAALVGGEDALVVNNCAAAVLLVATALAGGREVIVSRGELVEIGGGFRVPEIIAACGARLVEVGTTNRTRLADYQRALGDATGMVLKVHRSNFDLVGFTAEAGLAPLAALASAHGVPLVHDLGSGAFVDTAPFGLPHEPTARESIRDGVDLVLTSGDKLLGGPQAGLVIGRRALVDRLRAHPLARALRPGRLVLAALEATMRAYAEGAARERIPVVAMLSASDDTLRARAERLAAAVRTETGTPVAEIEITRSEGRVGGGSMPSARLDSWAVRIGLGSERTIVALERALRLETEPPVVGRIEAGHLVLDVRTVSDDEVIPLARGLARALLGIQKEGGSDVASEIEPDRVGDGDEDDAP